MARFRPKIELDLSHVYVNTYRLGENVVCGVTLREISDKEFLEMISVEFAQFATNERWQ